MASSGWSISARFLIDADAVEKFAPQHRGHEACRPLNRAEPCWNRDGAAIAARSLDDAGCRCFGRHHARLPAVESLAHRRVDEAERDMSDADPMRGEPVAKRFR